MEKAEFTEHVVAWPDGAMTTRTSNWTILEGKNQNQDVQNVHSGKSWWSTYLAW